MRVTVLGGGSWGTTVAHLMARHHEVTLWARDASVVDEINNASTNASYLPGFSLDPTLQATNDVEHGVRDAELVVVGVPTGAVRSTVASIVPILERSAPIVSLAKGLEPESNLRMTEVIAQEAPDNPVAALTGPNIAREIMGGQAAASVVASSDLAVASAVQSVLQRGVFRTYVNHDVVGCELGGALKNVIAIATGIAQGLGVGDNTRAMVMTRGLAELTRLGVAMGGEAATFSGLAGMGDLLATCMSPHSRNRTVGERLGAGESLTDIQSDMHMVAEGVKMSVIARELAETHAIEMPIHDEIYRVVAGTQDARTAYRGLRIEPGHEADPG